MGGTFGTCTSYAIYHYLFITPDGSTNLKKNNTVTVSGQNRKILILYSESLERAIAPTAAMAWQQQTKITTSGQSDLT